MVASNPLPCIDPGLLATRWLICRILSARPLEGDFRPKLLTPVVLRPLELVGKASIRRYHPTVMVTLCGTSVRAHLLIQRHWKIPVSLMTLVAIRPYLVLVTSTVISDCGVVVMAPRVALSIVYSIGSWKT